ncbi:MAG: serine hydrolase domain-containing protein [Flavobacteriaceae bacterium]
MILYKLFIFLFFFSFSNLFAQVYKGFSNKDVQSMHDKWNLENWDDGGKISRYTYLNMPEFWTHAIINRNGNVKNLIEDYRKEVEEFVIQSDLGEMSLQSYVNTSDMVDGMIVLHGNQIVYEAYPRMFAYEKHLYMSVSKVFASTLISILEERNLLDVSKPIDYYLPELKKSGWENVPIIDILDMASGIDCREFVEGAYENPETCYYQFEAALGFLTRTEKTADNAYDYIKSLSSSKVPGNIFEYTSVNTFVLSNLVERITGLSYAKNIEREIWQKIGAESDALITQTNGISISHVGINSTLRDLARFGHMFLPEGRSSKSSFVSEKYYNRIQKEGRPQLLIAYDSKNNTLDSDIPHHNTYQWDKVMVDGDFYKSGFGGQGLYISPSRNLVIAFFGTTNDDGMNNQCADIARQIAKSGLFE